jgi:hypothetical protein
VGSNKSPASAFVLAFHSVRTCFQALLPSFFIPEGNLRLEHPVWVYLDSKDEFTTVIHMYRRRGYKEIPRFNNNPQDTISLRKQLTA